MFLQAPTFEIGSDMKPSFTTYSATYAMRCVSLRIDLKIAQDPKNEQSES